MAIGIVPTDYMTIILDDYFGLFWMLTQRFAGAPLQVDDLPPTVTYRGVSTRVYPGNCADP